MTILVGDCRDIMKSMDADSVSAIVCDPPYNLSFMGKEFDKIGTPEQFERWTESWAREAIRVLRPGGYCLAFGGTRTVHRLTCGLEDAGFEIRDEISVHGLPARIDWVFGSGFPKSLDVGKAMDKAAGAERQRVAENPHIKGRKFGQGHHEGWERPWMQEDDADARFITAPATDLARQWDGWGTGIKPSHEPVVCAVKPYEMPGDYAIIDNNLLGVEEALCRLCVKSAGESSRHTPHGSSEVKDGSVLTNAQTSTEDYHKNEILIGAADDTNSEAATSGSTLEVASIASNMISSWRRILADACDMVSRSTTEMTSSLITDLKTWSLLLSRITPNIMLQAVLNPSGATALVASVEQLSNVVALKSSAIQILSALERATSPDHLNSPAEDARRPAHEPIVVARKPLTSTVAANVERYGTGALNIAASRIGTTKGVPASAAIPNANTVYGKGWDRSTDTDGWNPNIGRWPANVILTHSPLCRESCVPECAVRLLDEQSGERKSGGYPSAGGQRSHVATYGKPNRRGEPAFGASEGTASRFFLNTSWQPGELDEAARFRYTAKASRRERNAGLEGMPETDATPRNMIASKWIIDPRHPNGGYDANPSPPRANDHPTVKPVALMRYLVRLVTPPDGVVLDMFAGSGTTGMAASLEGLRFVGIEQDESYAEIATKRIAHVERYGERWLEMAGKQSKGQGATSRFGQTAGGTRQCNTCGTRSKQSGPQGRWPNCDHDDWSWVPLLADARDEPRHTVPSADTPTMTDLPLFALVAD